MKIILSLLLSFFSLTLAAQTISVNDLVENGIKLYDKGDYNGALVQYNSAFAIDKKSTLVNYEMALTYFALKNYAKTLEHCNAVIKIGTGDLKAIYGLKGSAEDLLGKPKDAIKTYKEGISRYPDNYLLYYNLALTEVNDQQYKPAEEHLELALRNNPNHASSHLLLSNLMRYYNKRAQAMLAIYNFLLLEPNGQRAKTGAATLLELYNEGVDKGDAQKMTINLNINDNGDEFSRMNIMISLLVANWRSEKNKDKNEAEGFADATKSFLTMLSEMKKDQKGFWWEFYGKFYKDLVESDHAETFSYMVNQANGDENVLKWLSANKGKVELFISWYDAYKR